MGDYVDFASPSNRQRLASAGLYDTATNVIELASDKLTKELYERALKPTRDRWLGMLEGHHFYQYSAGETTDMRLCSMLRTQHLGSCAYVRLVFEDKHSKIQVQRGRDRKPRIGHVTLWVHHGMGSGKRASAPLNALDQLPIYWDADIYLMGHQCLPDRARILTRSGFKHHRQVLVGQEVLAYDTDLRQLRWTPLRKVVLPGVLPMIRLESKSFSATASPGHEWVGETHDGVVKMWRTDEIPKGYHLRIAAIAEAGDHQLTDREAVIFGWLLTDGSIRKPRGYHDWRIYQKKPIYRSKIAALLRDDASVYLAENGVATYYLHADLVKILASKIGPEGLETPATLVTRLSGSARRAMLEAMIEAEGDGSYTFAQKPGVVWDAFVVLATLEGIRLGRFQRSPSGFSDGHVLRTKLLKRGGNGSQRVNAFYLERSMVEPELAWCPVTDFGTWVAELDGQVMITGNSKKVAAPLQRVLPVWSGKGIPHLQHRTIFIACTGSFSKAYIPGNRQGRVPRGDYVEKAMMNPAALGGLKIKIIPRWVAQQGVSKRGSRHWQPEISIEQ